MPRRSTRASGWSDDGLSLLGDPGADLVGDEMVGDEMASGDVAGYETRETRTLAEDRQSHQEPAARSLHAASRRRCADRRGRRRDGRAVPFAARSVRSCHAGGGSDARPAERATGSAVPTLGSMHGFERVMDPDESPADAAFRAEARAWRRPRRAIPHPLRPHQPVAGVRRRQRHRPRAPGQGLAAGAARRRLGRAGVAGRARRPGPAAVASG